MVDICVLIYLYTDPISLPIQDGSITSIYRGHVQCNGSESSFVDCEAQVTNNSACKHPRHRYAGVKCFTGEFHPSLLHCILAIKNFCPKTITFLQSQNVKKVMFSWWRAVVQGITALYSSVSMDFGCLLVVTPGMILMPVLYVENWGS